jgi:protein phosphatase
LNREEEAVVMKRRQESPTEKRPPQKGRVIVDAYGRTARGKVRTTNEDQFLIASLNRQLDVIQTSLDAEDCAALGAHSQGWVFLVADGMGGHAAGEEASALAVETTVHFIRETMPWFVRLGHEQAEEAEDALRSIVRESHRAVRKAAEDHTDQRGMGTTLTLAYVRWPELFVVHAGDSRCYLLRGDDLQQITRDHTLAQDLAEQTDLDSEELDKSRMANVLTRAVGGGKQNPPEPAVYRSTLAEGDMLLLCSDGLTNMVSDERILNVLSGEGFANARCQKLLEAAMNTGGRDNATVIVASFEDFRETR